MPMGQPLPVPEMEVMVMFKLLTCGWLVMGDAAVSWPGREKRPRYESKFVPNMFEFCFGGNYSHLTELSYNYEGFDLKGLRGDVKFIYLVR